MFAGSTWVEVAVAAAASCEAEDVEVGAVIVTAGVELGASAFAAGELSTVVEPLLPGPLLTVTGVACTSPGDD